MNRITFRLLLLLCGSSLLLIACGDDTDVDVDSDTVSDVDATIDHEEMARRWMEAFNAGDFEALRSMYTDDYVYHGMGGELGVDDNLELIRSFKEAFDAQVEPLHSVSEGDIAAWHARMTGTHNGEFMGIAPTGNPVDVTGMGFQRIVDGKIAEEWENFNVMSLMMQLGAMEAPGDPTAAGSQGATTDSDEDVSESSAPDATAEGQSMGERWLAAFNSGDWETLRGMYSDDYVYHGSMNEEMGRDQAIGMLKGFHQAFNPTAEVIHYVSDGELEAWHARLTGTHSGSFMGMEATNNPINVKTMGFQRVENGKIVEEWEIFDAMALMQQMGMEMPQMGAGSAASADTSGSDSDAL